jgi:hypothetical protein
MPGYATRLEVFADYSQFYLMDEADDFDTAAIWDDQRAAENLVVAGPGVLGVATARNYTVPVTIEVENSEPDEGFDAWDHVSESSLAIRSGRMVVMGPADVFEAAPRIELRPGVYRVRVYYSGLRTVSTDRLDGDDHYRAVLWPGIETAPFRYKTTDGIFPEGW